MPSSDSISASQPLPSCTLHHQGSQPSGALDLSWSFLTVGKENKGLWAWLYSIFQKVSAFEGLPGSDSLLPTSKGAAATSCHPIPPPSLVLLGVELFLPQESTEGRGGQEGAETH